MKRIVLGLGCVLLWSSCSTSNGGDTEGRVDTGKALDYCSAQVNRTLQQLQPIDYTMMPRNIMADQTHWNLRKATKEE